MTGSRCQMAARAVAPSECITPATSAGPMLAGASGGSMTLALDSLSPTSRLDTGSWLEKAGRLEEAVACYHSSLACMPDRMGLSEWFMAYLLDRQRAPLYSTDVAARVYESLARSLEGLARGEDAGLAREAARRLRGADASPEVYDLVGPRVSPGSCADGAGASIHREGRNSDRRTADALTIVMFTHFSNKLKKKCAPVSPGGRPGRSHLCIPAARVWRWHRGLPQNSVLRPPFRTGKWAAG
jgi:hypothetical protein